MFHYELSDEELQEIVSSCHFWNEVLTKLNMKTMTRSLQRRIQKSNIKHDHISKYFDGLHTKFNKFTKEQIEDIVRNNTDWNVIMNQLGYNSCTHIPIIKNKLDKLEINYHHLPNDIIVSRRRYALEEILVEDSPYCGGMQSLLKRLKQERNWQHICSICNLSEWNGKPIPLEIDHIDGCHTNNTYTNLRAICPNCHAQTDTYKGKNMLVCKLNPNPKPEPKPPKPKPEEQKCEGCSIVIDRRYTRCTKCKSKNIFESGENRKVERPSYKQLQEDIKHMSMVQVGKKYGVSDNGVRKWLKKYEKYSTPPQQQTY